ncbi:MAG: hypothetical protein ABW003_13720 [Microvirga sp.]
MSKLTDTKRAYERVRDLLEQQLLTRRSDAQEVRDALAAVEVAFYLLGWSQFEFLARKEAEQRIKGYAASKTADGIAWRYVNDNIKAFSLRRKLDVIFSANQTTLGALNKDYDLRNEAAHNYQKLPSEARDVAAWLEHLEDLVSRF